MFDLPFKWFLALSITVKTSITTATVTFHHKKPKGITVYEAYVNSLEGNKCTVAANAKPLQCTLRGIKEASNFNVVARACFSSKGKCETPIEVAARTMLRGDHLLFFFLLKKTADWLVYDFITCRCGWFKVRCPFTNITQRDSFPTEKLSSWLLRSLFQATRI